MQVILNFLLQTTGQTLYGLFTWAGVACSCNLPLYLTPSFSMLQSHGLFCFRNTTCFSLILGIYRVLSPVLQVSFQALSLSSKVMHALVRPPLAALTKAASPPHLVVQYHSSLLSSKHCSQNKIIDLFCLFICVPY